MDCSFRHSQHQVSVCIIGHYLLQHCLRLEKLTLDYSISLEMFHWLLTRLSTLTSLAVGHARQRYSQHSSVARLTPSRWEAVLAVNRLHQLTSLSIPVLFQPEDSDPSSQVNYYLNIRHLIFMKTYFHPTTGEYP